MENIDAALTHVRDQLLAIRPRGALLNGNIEMFLKTLFASHFDHIDQWSYVMDKDFHKQEVDLLLIEEGVPRAAVEFKCTLLGDPGSCRSAAEKALLQARKNSSLRLGPVASKCRSYIVHFLCAHYRTSDLPAFVYEKFARLKSSVTSENLLQTYKEATAFEATLSRTLICDEPTLPGVELCVIAMKLGEEVGATPMPA